MIKIICSAILFLLSFSISAQDKTKQYQIVTDIAYTAKNETDAYRKERCKLDIYYPANKKDFSTIVWFHGGGLEAGEKHIPSQLKDKGMAIVSVNYRLSPKASNPAYILDAAEAVAWVFDNIASYGGSVDHIYVSGHSAGGYLTLMLGLDKSYLQKHGVDADKVRGYAPISGQTLTHYTIRKERNIPMEIPVADQFAPLNKVRRNIRPMLLIAGDRHRELAARFEENALLEASLRSLDNKDVTLYEMQGFDHGSVVVPACYLISEWIEKMDKR